MRQRPCKELLATGPSRVHHQGLVTIGTELAPDADRLPDVPDTIRAACEELNSGPGITANPETLSTDRPGGGSAALSAGAAAASEGQPAVVISLMPRPARAELTQAVRGLDPLLTDDTETP